MFNSVSCTAPKSVLKRLCKCMRATVSHERLVFASGLVLMQYGNASFLIMVIPLRRSTTSCEYRRTSNHHDHSGKRAFHPRALSRTPKGSHATDWLYFNPDSNVIDILDNIKYMMCLKTIPSRSPDEKLKVRTEPYCIGRPL